jgi:hypothetical protein
MLFEGPLSKHISCRPRLRWLCYLTSSFRFVVSIASHLCSYPSFQVYLYPATPATQAAFAKIAASLSFPLRIHSEDTEDGGRVRILGHQVSIDEPSTGLRPVAYPTWSLSLPVDEDIQALLPSAARGPVASIGKVLGNRTTLYKYLNPRLFTVLTASPTRSMCGIYVVDSMKGTLVYHAEVRSTLRGCEVKTALTENWLVYHYYESDGTAGGAKGYRMVSVEFYEGQKEDEKTKRYALPFFPPLVSSLINFIAWRYRPSLMLQLIS